MRRLRDEVDGIEDRLLKIVCDVLTSASIEFVTLRDQVVEFSLPGAKKRQLPVRVELDARSLRATAHVSREVDDQHEHVYRYLLRKNQRHGPVHFAVDTKGDVLLVGWLPRESVTAARFDELLGALISVADETFDAILRKGFERYIEDEQTWRHKRGIPANPIAMGSSAMRQERP